MELWGRIALWVSYLLMSLFHRLLLIFCLIIIQRSAYTEGPADYWTHVDNKLGEIRDTAESSCPPGSTPSVIAFAISE